MQISFETLETPALTKAQLSDLLFEQIGLNKRESRDMVDAFFDLMVDSIDHVFEQARVQRHGRCFF